MSDEERKATASTIRSLDRTSDLLKEASTAIDVMAKILSELQKNLDVALIDCSLSKWNLERRIRFGADDDD